MNRIGLLAVIASLWLATALAEPAGSFPRPPGLEPDIQFWIRAYTEVGTNGGLIHDGRHLDVVYESVRFPEGSSNRTQRRQVKEAKKRYKKILLTLARGKREGLSEEQSRVLALWPENVSNKTLKNAAYGLRFQLGQSDKFRAGLIRSGAWEAHIRETLSEMGLPVELVALPHVESSYNPKARSHIGAAGLWQFTRSTGRRYLRIDSSVDERMDPYTSTVAAARLLSHNRSVTGSWPLAITAYNHGAAGMRRAARRFGTRDITTIVRRYNSRRFGFASRNFYVAFLAAVEIHFNAEKYFGELERAIPTKTHVVTVPDYVSVGTLQRMLGVDRKTLRDNNPALRRSVWRGVKYVPRGFELRLPSDLDRDTMVAALAQIDADERYGAQTRDHFYKVRRGNTLAGIGAHFDVSVDDLMAVNGIRNPHRIRAGQVLRLSVPKGTTTVASADGVPITPEALPRAEPTSTLPEDGLYTVKRGDNVATIARRFGLNEENLVATNELGDGELIYAGQVIRLAAVAPPSEEVATSTESSASERVVNRGERVETAAPADVVTTLAAAPAEISDAEIAKVERAEPVSAEEAEHFAPALPPAIHPELMADPSDYSVSSDESIEVQATETLGHYADWLELRAWRLRRLNDMSYREPVVIGQRLLLDFSRVDIASFEHKRRDYHRALQEAFFARYRISGTSTHVIRRGESLWVLAKRTYRIPMWLLLQHNPDLDIDAVSRGATITIPVLAAISEEASTTIEPKPAQESTADSLQKDHP